MNTPTQPSLIASNVNLIKDLDAKKSELADIRNELNRLAEKEKLVAKLVDAYELLVSQYYDVSIGGEAEPEHQGQEGRVNYIVNLGFRDAIRRILAESDRGMMPKDIAIALKKADYPYTAATDMGLRISNDLNKLKNSGVVYKDEDGYRLARQGGT